MRTHHICSPYFQRIRVTKPHKSQYRTRDMSQQRSFMAVINHVILAFTDICRQEYGPSVLPSTLGFWIIAKHIHCKQLYNRNGLAHYNMTYRIVLAYIDHVIFFIVIMFKHVFYYSLEGNDTGSISLIHFHGCMAAKEIYMRANTSYLQYVSIGNRNIIRPIHICCHRS